MLPDQNEVMRRAEHERKLRYEAKLRAVSRRVRRVNGAFLSVCPFLFGFRELSFFFFLIVKSVTSVFLFIFLPVLVL